MTENRQNTEVQTGHENFNWPSKWELFASIEINLIFYNLLLLQKVHEGSDTITIYQCLMPQDEIVLSRPTIITIILVI